MSFGCCWVLCGSAKLVVHVICRNVQTDCLLSHLKTHYSYVSGTGSEKHKPVLQKSANLSGVTIPPSRVASPEMNIQSLP